MPHIKRGFLIEAIILLSIIANCQSGVKIIPVNMPASLKWSYDSLYNFTLNVTNYTDSSIAIFKDAYAYDKNRMGEMEIGVKMRLGGRQVQKYCAHSVQYVVFPKAISVNPKETKSVTAQFGGDCFVKKGKYKIKFFLKIPFNKNGKKRYKKFSSKIVEISLI